MAEQVEVHAEGDLLKGNFKIKNTKYEVSLSGTEISWKKNGGKGESTISIIDIVSVKVAASKSAKPRESDSWILCYAERKKKNLLKKASVIFIGEPTECVEWTNRIQQQLNALEQRPRKILVLINPISGWSKGEKNYKSKVAPLFTEANITTDVKVTEHGNHMGEILATYDLTTIDSIAFVGGDGSYYAIVNALMKRKIRESNIDLNQPDADLPQLDIPIGIIPCGTGNGAAETNLGCKDVETAALAIIIGKQNRASIDSVHCGGELVAFSVLLIGYCMWSELIYLTEQRRHLGVFRYPIIMFNSLMIKTPRPVRLSIQYKASSLDKTTGNEKQDKEMGDKSDRSVEVSKTTEDRVTSGTSESTEWVTLEKDYIGPISMNMNLFAKRDDSVDDLFKESLLLAIQPCTRMQMLKFMGQLVKGEIGQPLEFVDYISTTEYKMKIVNPSDPTTTNGIVECLIDIDGEAVEIKEPEFTVRHFPKKLLLYANVPEDYNLSKVKARTSGHDK